MGAPVIEAVPVITDRDLHLPSILDDGDVHVSRLAVLAGVGERLLDDAIYARLQLGGQAVRRLASVVGEADLAGDLQAAAAGTLDQRGQRGLQPELVNAPGAAR